MGLELVGVFCGRGGGVVVSCLVRTLAIPDVSCILAAI